MFNIVYKALIRNCTPNLPGGVDYCLLCNTADKPFSPTTIRDEIRDSSQFQIVKLSKLK